MILDKTTPKGKAWRTFYQGLGAALVHLPFIILIPEVRDWLQVFPPVVMLTVAAASGVIAYFQNKKGL